MDRPAPWKGDAHIINHWCVAAYAFVPPAWKPWRILLLTTTSTARLSSDWPAGLATSDYSTVVGGMVQCQRSLATIAVLPLDHAGHGASSQEPPPYEVGRSHILRWE
ncbi:hypothetical protein DHEL01_v202726 [Diaporthe helianthi]|uniref:Uncharacterized protein n=1 Tax=Diaporthe helianthi TaxID=158607 RepID=A0A2P5I8Q5_DIAHE|nr:hypothetical protein DHEL01_v202726 [Diaporthe helianthi]